MSIVMTAIALILASVSFSYSVSLSELFGFYKVETRSYTAESHLRPNYADAPLCRTQQGGMDYRVFAPKTATVALNCDAWFDAFQKSKIINAASNDLRILDIRLLTDSDQQFFSRTIQRRFRTFRFGLYYVPTASPTEHVALVEHELYHVLSLKRYAEAGYTVPHQDRLFVALEETRAELATICKLGPRGDEQSGIDGAFFKSAETLVEIAKRYASSGMERREFYDEMRSEVSRLAAALPTEKTMSICRSLLDFDRADVELDYDSQEDIRKSLHLEFSNL